MFKRRYRLPSPAFVIALVALFAALGGTSFAATKVIAAKHKDAKADTKLVKKLAPSLSVKHAKTANSASAAANATHATSADSATNATSATHATSADSATNATNAADSAKLGGIAANGYEQKIRWALVAGNGTIIAQSGGISVAAHPFAGGYYLDWGAPLTNTALISSLAGADSFAESVASSICGGGAQGVACGSGANNANETFTFTTSDHNTEADHTFYIASMS
jgi:hypothetical protein